MIAAENVGIPTVGLYIGWPGASLKNDQFLSFWNREPIADTVGNGDLVGVMRDILKAAKGPKYDDENSHAVVIGHSFGGLVLERVAIQLLSEQLKDTNMDAPSPADLFLLINEAGVATIARPFLLELQKKGVSYEDKQGNAYPLLLSMTTLGDVATEFAYPGGEFLSFNRRTPETYTPSDIFGQTSSLPYDLLTAAHMVALQSHQIVPFLTPAACKLPITLGDQLKQPIPKLPSYCMNPVCQNRLNVTPYWIMPLPQVFVPDHSSGLPRQPAGFDSLGSAPLFQSHAEQDPDHTDEGQGRLQSGDDGAPESRAATPEEGGAMTRRGALSALGASAVSSMQAFAGPPHPEELSKPYGWVAERIQKRTVYVRGSGRRVIVLLHEINGLSPGCVDFGVELASHGFKVYMPLLFGHVLQDSLILGSIESCWLGGFRCTSPGTEKDTKPVIWVRDFVASLDESADAIGVIGMCETGAYPLATMRRESNVKAVVLSQPALPISQERQRDVGISPEAMKEAKEERYSDPRLPFQGGTRSRLATDLEFLQNYFEGQLKPHPLDGPADFHQTWSHRLHAVLTGPFDGIREQARHEAIRFLESWVR